MIKRIISEIEINDRVLSEIGDMIENSLRLIGITQFTTEGTTEKMKE